MTDNWMPKMTKTEFWHHHRAIWCRADKTDKERSNASRNLHREYYAQFVDAAYISAVVEHIGKDRLLTSKNKDGCFNDIVLQRWDSAPWPHNHRARMKICGDVPTTFPVCEAKEAARQWHEKEIEAHIQASLDYKS